MSSPSSPEEKCKSTPQFEDTEVKPKMLTESQEVVAPPGLRSLLAHCTKIYPEQKNPLQITTRTKYWLGGQDPLDYISMYYNKGDTEKGIPPHWHYISFGMSDLHGDERVHVINKAKIVTEREKKSGMGFEMTFRLIINDFKDGGKLKLPPPTWPATLLQNLARYCFQTGNRLCPGDNIPWRKPLNASSASPFPSQIANILIGEDPQLGKLDTPLGSVEYCQIVGVTQEEIDHAARWNGKNILNFLKKDFKTGGPFLVTDMDRIDSVFKLFPECIVEIENELQSKGSELAGINAGFTFKELLKRKAEDDSEKPEEKMVLESLRSLTLSNVSASLNTYIKDTPLGRAVYLAGIEITFSPSAVDYLTLALRDRVRHGKHFTFKSDRMALTFVAEGVSGAAVSKDQRYGVLGYWIQVLITPDLLDKMLHDFKDKLDNNKNIRKEFFWEEENLRVIVDTQLPTVFSGAFMRRW